MKKLLQRIVKNEVYYFKGSEKIVGTHENIYGDVSGIRGNMSHIHGDVSDISGNVDLCEITLEERKVGIKVEELIEGETI